MTRWKRFQGILRYQSVKRQKNMLEEHFGKLHVFNDMALRISTDKARTLPER